MKRHSLLAAVLLATMLACANSDAPRIKVSSRMSLGEVGAGQSVEFALPVRNEGKTPLRIADISGSCSCIVPLQTRGEVAPRAEHSFPLTLSTRDQTLGTHRQRITLRSNDPTRLNTAVELLYFVRPGLTLSPEAIRVLQPVTLPAEYEVKLVVPAGQSYELKEANAAAPIIETLTPTLPAACSENGLTLRLRLKCEPHWVGPLDTTVTFKLTNLRTGATETLILPIFVLRMA